MPVVRTWDLAESGNGGSKDRKMWVRTRVVLVGLWRFLNVHKVDAVITPMSLRPKAVYGCLRKLCEWTDPDAKSGPSASKIHAFPAVFYCEKSLRSSYKHKLMYFELLSTSHFCLSTFSVSFTLWLKADSFNKTLPKDALGLSLP